MRPVIVFDMDDTLFPERAFVESGFRAVGAWLRDTHGVDGAAERAVALFQSGMRGTIFDRVLQELEVDAATVTSGDLVRIYRAHRPDITLHEDAAWALATFGATHRLALLTDGFLATQRNKVAALGIEPAFEAIVYSDEFGRDRWKPHPRPYQAVMERVGCQASDCAYVSDNPTKDFVTANALGWDTVQIDRADGEYRNVEIRPGYAAARRVSSLFDL